jgi:MFS family permease
VRFDLFQRLPFVVALTGTAVTAFAQNPMTLFVPLYLQSVLLLSPLDAGLLMVSFPLATLVAGPLGGRLADRYSPGLVAASGLAVLLGGVLVYAQLSLTTPPIAVLVPLVLAGAGGAIARPANQVVAYRCVTPEEYGSLAAMLNSAMMLAGTLGTTIAVAVAESMTDGTDSASFAVAQSRTFVLLLPVLALGVAVSLVGGWRRREMPAELSPTLTAS